MKLANYSGYTFTLHTTLSVAECRQILRREFHDAHGRWRRATSNQSLQGKEERGAFFISPSTYIPSRHHTNNGVDDLFLGLGRHLRTTRVCQIQLRAGGGLTTLTGSYGYDGGEQALLGFVITMTFGFVFGPLLLVVGLILMFQEFRLFWIALLGVAIIGACIALIRDTGDRKFPRERDQIKAYLAQILAAKVEEPAPGRKAAS